MSKISAVEFLIEQITNSTMPARKAIEQAKAMFEDQIETAYYDGGYYGCPSGIMGAKKAKEYFKENFKNK